MDNRATWSQLKEAALPTLAVVTEPHTGFRRRLITFLYRTLQEETYIWYRGWFGCLSV